MKYFILTFLGAVSALLIAGCGSGGGGGSNSTTTTNSICSSGLVNTQYGCLQQGMCPAGQAQYNNTCVMATTNTCPSGTVYVSQVGQCLSQGSCPAGQAMYNNTCIIANNTSGIYNNGMYNTNLYNNGMFNTGYYNTGYNTGYNNMYNPYLPQQNTNYWMTNPYTNPYWTPQYYYYRSW